MGYLSIDLGTTNIKVAAYDEKLNELGIVSEPVQYIRENNFVEFDAEDYYDKLLYTIKKVCEIAFRDSPYPIEQIILTGQAESLVVVDQKMKPLRNAISWLDMRSSHECEVLQNTFPPEVSYQITGQPEIIPTWPITKILWIKKNESELFKKAHKYLLLKDYIQYCLTGKLFGEYSIYNFSHYFNISTKQYWDEILDFCGITANQLPELIEPCTVIGSITAEISQKTQIGPEAKVNVGTLDHFAGMIGTGNITPGIISESTGTVLSIATMVEEPVFSKESVPCHYGPFKNSYVLLPVCESGGISLEWYKNEFIPELSYDELNQALQKVKIPNEIVFLPYLTGVNAPDFDTNAKGVFYGLRMKHTRIDMALSVMEGIAHLLKRNVDTIEKAGYKVEKIISTGGGAKSDLWSQIKAEVTNKIILIPNNEEAACLGAAIIGWVSSGKKKSFQQAINECVSIKKEFTPKNHEAFQLKYEMFDRIYENLTPIFSKY